MAAIGAFGAAVARGIVPKGVESECVQQVLAAIEDRSRASLPAKVRPDRGTWILGGSGARTLVHGDSMVEQCLPRFVRLLENAASEGRGAIVIADGGDIPIPGVRNPGTRTDLAALEQRFRRAIEEDPSIDRVVISGGWLGYFSAWTKCTIDGVSLAEEAAIAFSRLLARLPELRRGRPTPTPAPAPRARPAWLRWLLGPRAGVDASASPATPSWASAPTPAWTPAWNPSTMVRGLESLPVEW